MLCNVIQSFALVVPVSLRIYIHALNFDNIFHNTYRSVKEAAISFAHTSPFQKRISSAKRWNMRLLFRELHARTGSGLISWLDSRCTIDLVTAGLLHANQPQEAQNLLSFLARACNPGLLPFSLVLLASTRLIISKARPRSLRFVFAAPPQRVPLFVFMHRSRPVFARRAVPRKLTTPLCAFPRDGALAWNYRPFIRGSCIFIELCFPTRSLGRLDR